MLHEYQKQTEKEKEKNTKTFVCKLKDSQFKNAQQHTGKTDPRKTVPQNIFIEARC